MEILWFILRYFSAQFMAQVSSPRDTFLVVNSQTQSVKHVSLSLLYCDRNSLNERICSESGNCGVAGRDISQRSGPRVYPLHTVLNANASFPRSLLFWCLAFGTFFRLFIRTVLRAREAAKFKQLQPYVSYLCYACTTGPRFKSL